MTSGNSLEMTGTQTDQLDQRISQLAILLYDIAISLDDDELQS